MAQEDDLRALGKIMDFLRAVSIILAIMNVYWYCYEAMRMWGVTIGVVDRILINFNRTGGLFHSILYTKLFSLLLLALSCLEEVLQMKHRKLHLTGSCVERRRNEKGEVFNRVIKVDFLMQWRKSAFNQKQFV